MWKVEMSAEILIGANVKQCYLSARNNHEDRPDGFGGYPLYIDVDDQEIFFKKEQTHQIGYSERLASKKATIPRNEWFKATVRVTNIEEGKVKIVATVNGTTTELTDSGQITCKNDNEEMKNTPPFTGTGKSCFLRTNSTSENSSVDIKYRNVVIKPI
jgi:hypothetical protein